jgi:hypothetical protein
VATVRVKAHHRRGTRGVRPSLRWVVPAEDLEDERLRWLEMQEAFRHTIPITTSRPYWEEPYEHDRVASLEKTLRARRVVPAITMRQTIGGDPYLADGFHRIVAAHRAGVKRVPYILARVETG